MTAHRPTTPQTTQCCTFLPIHKKHITDQYFVQTHQMYKFILQNILFPKKSVTLRLRSCISCMCECDSSQSQIGTVDSPWCYPNPDLDGGYNLSQSGSRNIPNWDVTHTPHKIVCTEHIVGSRMNNFNFSNNTKFEIPMIPNSKFDNLHY